MEKETERKCIVTGLIKPQSELLRFVKTADNQLIPDFNKNFAGKGIYVSVSRQALQKALEKKLFTKAVHDYLKIPDNLMETVEHLLRKKSMDSLNLARKAGALVTGFEKVKECILKNKVAFLIEAADAGVDGSGKMAVLAKNLEVLKLYNTAELDEALNKVNTVHVAILKGSMSDMVYNNLKRYQAFLD